MFEPHDSGYTVAAQERLFRTVTILDIVGDDAVEAVDLPFSVLYFGRTFNRVWVSTGGLVTFTDPGPTFSPANLPPIPSPATPNGAILVFGQALHVGEGSVIRTEIRGSAPQRQLLVEWHNVATAEGSDERFSAEVLLAENGPISFDYTGLESPAEHGADALVGVENPEGDLAVTYSYHEASLSNDTAVKFTPQGLAAAYEVEVADSSGVETEIRSDEPIMPFDLDVHSVLDASMLAGDIQASLAYDFSLNPGQTFEDADITIRMTFGVWMDRTSRTCGSTTWTRRTAYGAWPAMTSTSTRSTRPSRQPLSTSRPTRSSPGIPTPGSRTGTRNPCGATGSLSHCRWTARTRCGRATPRTRRSPRRTPSPTR